MILNYLPMRVPLAEISGGTAITTVAIVAASAYVFYLVGKRSHTKSSTSESVPDPSLASKVFKANPSTIQAQQAFIDNLDKILPFFSGVSSIQIDRDGLTDAIIDINDEDLVSLWRRMIDRPELWINQMAAWGVKPESCISFVAMPKHQEMYSVSDGTNVELGKKYLVKSACWVRTITKQDGSVAKEIVRKGIVEAQL